MIADSTVGEDRGGGGRLLGSLLVAVSVVVYAAGFVHLRADFPNGSHWMDWAKMTDEGWYGGAALHHFLLGHWYLPDSFNPAVAMPLWPAMLAAWFEVTGLSMVAARVLTMLLYGASLVFLYRLVREAVPRPRGRVLAALAVFLTVVNPFCYAFDRLAVLEPATVFWMMLSLWLASETRSEDWLRQGLLGLTLLLLVLTKVTGVALIPGILYLVWASWGWPRGRVLGRFVLICAIPAGLWGLYFLIAIRPHYLADYRLLFSINAYRVHLNIIPREGLKTLVGGNWMAPVLFRWALAVIAISVVWLRSLWRMPMFGAAVLVITGQLAFIGYHTNYQPRYYLVIAMPMMVVVVLGAMGIWQRRVVWERIPMAAVLLLAGGMMAVKTWDFVTQPQYSFLEAAQSIAAVVRADGGGGPLLSDSGDDITLMTGLPAICEQYAVDGLDPLLRRYRPGWYAAWMPYEGPAIKAVGERYRLDEVARYRVFDDPMRQTLVLYKLTAR